MVVFPEPSFILPPTTARSISSLSLSAVFPRGHLSIYCSHNTLWSILLSVVVKQVNYDTYDTYDTMTRSVSIDKI